MSKQILCVTLKYVKESSKNKGVLKCLFEDVFFYSKISLDNVFSLIERRLTEKER